MLTRAASAPTDKSLAPIKKHRFTPRPMMPIMDAVWSTLIKFFL